GGAGVGGAVLEGGGGGGLGGAAERGGDGQADASGAEVDGAAGGRWRRGVPCTSVAANAGTASGPNPTAPPRASHPSKRCTPIEPAALRRWGYDFLAAR